MSEKKMLGDFIYELRKERGLSQSELGDIVGVSNKAVSKWETGEANPELGHITVLAKALDVSVDELLACKREEKRGAESKSKAFFISIGAYEYVSAKKTKNGTPYVHINFSSIGAKAKGIIAIGPFAKGIISMGFFSTGVISLGIFSLGVLALGSFALGLLAAGAVALGLGAAAGGVAVGTVAAGGVAIGIMAVGGVAIGYWAHTGVDGYALGINVFVHSSARLRGLLQGARMR